MGRSVRLGDIDRAIYQRFLSWSLQLVTCQRARLASRASFKTTRAYRG